MALDFDTRFRHSIFGIQFWSTILALDFYFGGQFGRSISARFCHLILAVDFVGQFWRSILAVNFGGKFWQSILADNFGA